MKGDEHKMSVSTNCVKICTELRRKGFVEEGITSVIPEDAVANAIWKQKWSTTNAARYRGAEGYLVAFEYLKIVPGGYTLTGDDLNEQ